MGGPHRPNFSIVPLASKHDRAAFSCGVAPLDRYLKQQAGQDLRKHAARTYVLHESDLLKVIGFYTLSATSVPLQDFSAPIRKKLPLYPNVPALLIGRLAVDQGHRGKGFGKLLMIDALKRCMATDLIGWTGVIVDAKDNTAVSFYESHEFIRLSPDADRLFLPRAMIEMLLK